MYIQFVSHINRISSLAEIDSKRTSERTERWQQPARDQPPVTWSTFLSPLNWQLMINSSLDLPRPASVPLVVSQIFPSPSNIARLCPY